MFKLSVIENRIMTE